jgi:hypothetical protein
MDKHADVKQMGGAGRRWRGQLRKLFLAGGLMGSAMVASPAFARPAPEKQPLSPAQKSGCVQGGRQTRYVSHERRFALDHSYLRVTWEPRFCKTGGKWVTRDLPTVSPVGVHGVILEFEAPHYISGGIEYRGRVRQCITVSAGLYGVGTSGTGCRTVGKASFHAKVAGSGVSYSWKMNGTSLVTIGGGNLKWTSRVI